MFSALLLGLATAVAVPAGATAQEDPGNVYPPGMEPPPSTTTTTTIPGQTPPPDPGAGDDAASEEVPVVDITVPPPDPTPPPPPGAPPMRPHSPGRVVVRNLAVAQRLAGEALDARDTASQRVAELRDRLVRLERKLDNFRAGRRRAMNRLERARDRLNERAAWAYMRGPVTDVNGILGARDPNQLTARLGMVRSVLEADNDVVGEFRKARQGVSAALARAADEHHQTELALRDAVDLETVAIARADEAELELAVFGAGSQIVIHGFVFPVADPHSFVDSFGAPRMPGTSYAHSHEGTDIFAPAGTPLLAAERGVVVSMGTGVLGGIKLWVRGESGAWYYYAHLSAYAEGIHDGKVVAAGDVVGYVGNTGNAVGTPSHLHFEIHPHKGPAVNPYPLLKVVDDLNKGRT